MYVSANQKAVSLNLRRYAVGGVYIKSKEGAAKDVLTDLVEMAKGVQQPIHGRGVGTFHFSPSWLVPGLFNVLFGVRTRTFSLKITS